MKPVLPDTVFTRLFGLVLAAIVVSHALTFVLLMVFWGDRFPPPPPPPPSVMQGHVPPPPPLGFWISISIQCIALTVAAWFGARTLAQPIQRLAMAATLLGENLNNPAIEESGPAEARQAARIFNCMQNRIRSQIDERGRFLAAVSHDLRTPLTRIKLRVERLTGESVKNRLREDINEMTAMLNATLDYLRGEAQTESWQLLDIQALVHSVADDAQETGQDITVSGDAKPLLAQPATLRRCVLNLVENAVRYGQKAHLSLIDAPDQLIIEIRDEGPGIPEDQMEQVFEPFFRLESSRNKTTGGVGLGLAIAREAVRRCGGELTLRNAEGGGLIANINLPRRLLI